MFARIRPFAFLFGLALLASGALGMLGCGNTRVDPAEVAALRKTLVLDAEPEDVQAVSDVRAALLGEPANNADHDHAVHDHADHDHADHDEKGGDEHEHGTNADHDHAHADLPDDPDDETQDLDHADHEEAAHDEHAHADSHADHDEHAEHDHDEHADHDHDEVMQDATSDKKLEVAIVGAVGGLPNPSEQSQPDFPFARDKAIIFLADPAAVAHFAEESHEHAPGEECSFCAAHAGDSSHMMAVVRFKDKQGKVLGIDARELFQLKGQETVVVKGTATIESGLVMVDATGLYVRE